MTKPFDATVVVVGGGPVGVTMALALQHHGVGCVVLERHPELLDFPRGRGITVRTMELMRRWGVADALVAAGFPKADRAIFLGESLLADQFQRLVLPDPGRSSTSPTESLLCDQNAMERVLRRTARERDVDLRLRTTVTGIEQYPDHAQTTYIDETGTERSIRSAYVVAADGAHSSVRSRLGIELHGVGAVAHAMTILIDAPLAPVMVGRTSVMYRLAGIPGGTILAVDNDRRWALVYEYDPTTDPRESFTPNRLRSLARTAIGSNNVTFEIVGHRFWTSTALVADQFRNGRVFLVGDAAHTTTPIGGLGMNCGMGDVDNLAWKLAAVVHGWATAALLDTYERERMPVAELTVEASLGRARPPSSVVGLVLGATYESEAVVPDGSAPPEVEDSVAQYVPSARPGHRAPHVWLTDEATISTLDHFGTSMTVLTGEAETAAQLASASYGSVPVSVHLLDPERWHSFAGVDADGAVLVRPDGYVGWRCPSEATPDGLANALRRITATTPV